MIDRVFVFSLLLAITVGGATYPTLSQPQQPSPDIPPDAMITLSREGLIVRILANGRVMVEGQTFDFDIGAIKMRTNRAEVRDLIDGFDRIDFFSLRDRYRDPADGCSRNARVAEVEIMQTTSLTLNGKSKSVTRHPHDCLEKDGSPYPRDLVTLERKIEAAVNLHKR